MTIDAASEDFLQANETYNEFAVLAAQLDEPQQSDASVAQLARWFSAQNTFLQDNLDVVAAEQGGTVTLTLDPAGIAGLAYSQAGSGYRDSAAGNNHQFLASDVAYIASAKNSVILQLATAEQPIVQDHEFEAEYEIQALDGPDPDGEGGPSPTVDFTTTFSAAPPLAAAATTLTAQDQAFINAAYDDGALGVQEGELAMSLGGSLNLQLYGAWNIVNDGPLDADIASLASTGQGTVPGALSATSQAQLATLAGLFSGLNGVAQVAAYSIINDQKTIADYSAEITAGSDPALVALAKAALPGAGALLAQAVILYGELARCKTIQ